MSHSYYLPRCCRCWWDSGQYVVGHTETSRHCRHTPSGGSGGSADGKMCCNRIIGHGATAWEAIANARENLYLSRDERTLHRIMASAG